MGSFVERNFELGSQRVLARFEMPERAETGEFRCRWSLVWPDRTEGDRACGEDGVQALMLAMKSVHIHLVQSDEYRTGRLTLWLQSDLDLPPTWGAGPLYYVPPRSEAVDG